MAEAKFSLGQLVATPGAIEALQASDEDASVYLQRHQSGDWGELDKEDWSLNDQAIAHEGNLDLQQRVLSAYQTKLHTKIWIITESDRSVTTVLLPSEY